jgi:hypothetical protein
MNPERLALLLFMSVVGCGGDGAENPGTDAAAAEAEADAPPVTSDDSQLPPQGHAAVTTWLAAKHYLSWACEDAPHPARPPGAHGTNRICSNAALSASASGAYPPGAASVKELYNSNGTINGYAIARKLPNGSGGASWYWYERINTSVVADSIGAGLCTSCHEDAARDFVFTRVE